MRSSTSLRNRSRVIAAFSGACSGFRAELAEVVASVANQTPIAERLWPADAAAVEDQRVRARASIAPAAAGRQCGFDHDGIVGAHEADPVRDAQDVAIDRQARHAERVPSTTFAVLRPTPGSVTSASIEAGTSPPCSATSARAIPMRLRDFCGRTRSAWICGSSSSGVGAGPAPARPGNARTAPASPDSRARRCIVPRGSSRRAAQKAFGSANSVVASGCWASRRSKIARPRDAARWRARSRADGLAAAWPSRD